MEPAVNRGSTGHHDHRHDADSGTAIEAAAERREHHPRGVPGDSRDTTAMEPAERREHLARRSGAAKVKFAAWSPPSNSRSTLWARTEPGGPAPRRNGARRCSAGTPALSLPRWMPCGSRNGARRFIGGSTDTLYRYPVVIDQPQWSPPLLGGSIAHPSAILTNKNAPQWSPPLIGGSIRHHDAPQHRGGLHTAMESAVDRREHPGGAVTVGTPIPPQWSPPLIGGSTRLDDAGLIRERATAMEPAVDRREHGSEDSGPLTCAGRSPCERSVNARRWAYSVDLSRCKKAT